jgi:hypothetical protein
VGKTCTINKLLYLGDLNVKVQIKHSSGATMGVSGVASLMSGVSVNPFMTSSEAGKFLEYLRVVSFASPITLVAGETYYIFIGYDFVDAPFNHLGLFASVADAAFINGHADFWQTLSYGIWDSVYIGNQQSTKYVMFLGVLDESGGSDVGGTGEEGGGLGDLLPDLPTSVDDVRRDWRKWMLWFLVAGLVCGSVYVYSKSGGK